MKGEKLKDFLKEHNINFDVIPHPLAYSAQMTAHTAHVPGKEMAKTVIVKVDGEMKMVVLTANQRVNFTLLKNVYRTNDISLAKESDFIAAFPDCEMGAMPPFGNLYGMEEIVSEELSMDSEIVFNAGTHTELIKMKFEDFKKLVNPVIMKFKIEY
ncbi:aminoacyl-tRNA deacylase [Spirochaetota bacterium]